MPILAPPMRAGHPTPWNSYGKAMLATVFWGSSFIAIRIALGSATASGIVWMRNMIAALLLFGLLRARGMPLLPERADRGRVLILGLLFGVHLIAQAIAMEHTSTMHAGWIIAFIPAIVIGWLGIAVATGGVLVLTATDVTSVGGMNTGDLIMLGTTITWAAYTLLMVKPSRGSGGLRVSASVLLVSLVPALLMAGAKGSWSAQPTTTAMLAILFLGACSSAIAMWVYTDAVAELGPERSAAFQYVQPLVTMAVAYIVLAEPVTGEQLIGGPLVLAGVWLVQRGKKNG
jgi:drug/metabolite transporter (DMT)-like permease